MIVGGHTLIPGGISDNGVGSTPTCGKWTHKQTAYIMVAHFTSYNKCSMPCGACGWHPSVLCKHIVRSPQGAACPTQHTCIETLCVRFAHFPPGHIIGGWAKRSNHG